MNPNQKAFIDQSIKIAKKNNIKVIFRDANSIKEMKCSGYFDQDASELVVAKKRPFHLWFPVFVHETCHMDQYLENTRIWTTTIKGSCERHDPLSLYEMYVDNIIELNAPVKHRVLELCIGVELDCEKRSVKKIKKYNLDLDVLEYTRHANLYCYLYTYCMHVKKWHNLANIFKRDPKILDFCPDTFHKNATDYFDIPQPLMKEFQRLTR